MAKFSPDPAGAGWPDWRAALWGRAALWLAAGALAIPIAFAAVASLAPSTARPPQDVQPPPSSASGQASAPASAQASPGATRAGRAPADVFYPGFDPAKDPLPPPRRGGRVIVHLAAMPSSLNSMIENSSVTRRMLGELHEFLIRQDWETWEYTPVLARSWETEDTLVLAGGRGADDSNILYGRLEDLGDRWRVTPVSTGGSALQAPREVPKDQVERVERETVYTFHLRPEVKWHDGRPFCQRDVLFSYGCFKNPFVHCDDKRFQFDKIVRAEPVGSDSVRFFFGRQYFLALSCFDSLTILPAHLYDLSDPSNPKHDPAATPEQQAKFIHEHPNNRQWVGLGPYRLEEWTSQALDAKRFPEYFDPARAGWVDSIRWRYIQSDDVAFRALLDGELDFFDRLSAEDYVGERTRSEEFTSRFYRGHFYAPYIGYTAWNLRRPLFADVRVRKALAMCFDWDEFIRGYFKGLAMRVTGEQFYESPYYDRTIEPVPFDLEGARSLLAEAGWYDRDGDGQIDREGTAFRFEFLMPTGNKTSELLGQRLQENLARVGVKMDIASRDWAAFTERLNQRDFDAANLGWIMPLEGDPEQAWHSKWSVKASSNRSGLADPKVDQLIEALQVELDRAERTRLFHELQRRIYDLQPYLFGVDVPHKFALSKRVRNFQMFAIDPGYAIRRWYLVD
jgi:peptide/nickel transport system substrate-binding protein